MNRFQTATKSTRMNPDHSRSHIDRIRLNSRHPKCSNTHLARLNYIGNLLFLPRLDLNAQNPFWLEHATVQGKENPYTCLPSLRKINHPFDPDWNGNLFCNRLMCLHQNLFFHCKQWFEQHPTKFENQQPTWYWWRNLPFPKQKMLQ